MVPESIRFAFFPPLRKEAGQVRQQTLTPNPLYDMAQAMMDPEEVRRFAKELKRFNDDTQGKAAALNARFVALGSTWQDQEHEKFAEEFVMTMKMLKKF